MKRLFTLALLICIGLGLFVAENFAAQDPRKPRPRHICQDKLVDAPGWELHRAPFEAPSKYAPSGVTYQTSCADINPEAGTIIEHDQIGDTWYEYQQNDNMGRMISVTGDGYRNFSWMYTDGPYPGVPRYVNANCKDPVGSFAGPITADGGEQRAGYSSQTHLHDGASVIAHHHSSGAPKWYTVLTMADGVCS
ncbi:MAG: hypothetical protein JSV10_05035, partial [Candidatus Zixiibacteriota bacterium]